TAVLARAGVAVAVVHSAVEADVWAPVAGVPEIAARPPTPVTRRPQKADRGERDPGAFDPVIAGGHGIPAPITWRPDVAGCRDGRLHVDGQDRRRDVDRDRDRRLRRQRRSEGDGKAEG